MEVTVVLAETSSSHPDGTVSLLRAGIDRVWGDSFPIPFRGALMVRVVAEPAEGGRDHEVEISALDEDGKDIMPRLNALLRVLRGGGAATLTVNFAMQFKKHGRYHFAATVDRIVRATWPLQVMPTKEAQDEKPA